MDFIFWEQFGKRRRDRITLARLKKTRPDLSSKIKLGRYVGLPKRTVFATLFVVTFL
jgi:hypothetical protein